MTAESPDGFARIIARNFYALPLPAEYFSGFAPRINNICRRFR